MTQLLRSNVRTRGLVPAPKVGATAKQRSEDESKSEEQGTFQEQLSERQTAADDAMTASAEERHRDKQAVALQLSNQRPGTAPLAAARAHSIVAKAPAAPRVRKGKAPAAPACEREKHLPCPRADKGKERVVKNLALQHLDVQSAAEKNLDVTQGTNIDERV